MGLRYVKGLAEQDGQAIEAARRERPFRSVDDFVRRSGLDRGAVARLAEAGAFAALEPSRRGAVWAARGAAAIPRDGMAPPAEEALPSFRELDAFESIGWDYRSLGHSAAGHPLAPLRDQLARQGFPDAHTVASLPGGRRVNYAGLVICRQRPGTASGVVFMTLEDETGFVNVVVWSPVYEAHRVIIKTVGFVGVTGKLQVQDGVTHLIAERLWRPKVHTTPSEVESRDFH